MCVASIWKRTETAVQYGTLSSNITLTKFEMSFMQKYIEIPASIEYISER